MGWVRVDRADRVGVGVRIRVRVRTMVRAWVRVGVWGLGWA